MLSCFDILRNFPTKVELTGIFFSHRENIDHNLKEKCQTPWVCPILPGENYFVRRGPGGLTFLPCKHSREALQIGLTRLPAGWDTWITFLLVSRPFEYNHALRPRHTMRQIAATRRCARLLQQIASAMWKSLSLRQNLLWSLRQNFVAAICRTNSN